MEEEKVKNKKKGFSFGGQILLGLVTSAILALPACNLIPRASTSLPTPSAVVRTLTAEPTATNTLTAEPTATIQPTPTPNFTCIGFFYDRNMNGRHDSGEEILDRLHVTTDVPSERGNGKCFIRAPTYNGIKFSVKGMSPNGKELKIVTNWLPCYPYYPDSFFVLPSQLREQSRLDGTIMIGLVDGTCVSPVRWEDMNHKLYDSYRQNPERLKKWLESFDFGGERPNWFLYGRRTGNRDPYNNEEIKHLALDIFTPYDNNIPVYAMIVGTAAPPNYDHAIRIKGNKFSIEYSHIIPEVSVGDNVCLGQLIGYVKPDRRLPTNTHVHVGSFGTGIQQTPDIVECFPGLTKEDIVFYPIKKDGINVIGPPRLPFYDYELKQLVTPLP